MSAARMLRVIMSTGERYDIPEIWLAGFCQAHGHCHPREAIAWWHQQALMEKEIAC